MLSLVSFENEMRYHILNGIIGTDDFSPNGAGLAQRSPCHKLLRAYSPHFYFSISSFRINIK